jgi:anti-sigma factor RsiW
MNCNEHRQAILDSLAAGEGALPAAVNQHLPSCAACSGFYQEQRELFHSMQSALEATVNQPVPPSLIPGIRARLEQNPDSRPFFLTGWKLLALPAVLMLIIGMGLLWHGTSRRNVAAVNQLSKQISEAPIAAKEEAPSIAATPSGTSSRSVRRISPARKAPQPVEPEVVVLPEEREAFDRFIAQVPDDPAMVAAFTRPLPEGNDRVVEIALLAIKPLQLKPLESSEE